jgi:hypothetical protein
MILLNKFRSLIAEIFFFQTTLPEFAKTDFLVVRQHEEFVWLHDRFEENEIYAGFIVRPRRDAC